MLCGGLLLTLLRCDDPFCLVVLLQCCVVLALLLHCCVAIHCCVSLFALLVEMSQRFSIVSLLLDCVVVVLLLVLFALLRLQCVIVAMLMLKSAFRSFSSNCLFRAGGLYPDRPNGIPARPGQSTRPWA